ncbi:hypothetical protein IVZ55_04740 [Salmonella enterica subsp. enterica serovar Worthington]|nr:hypothetical protein [Salmonella enterica subsp. enterica serovar Worthington]
MRGEKAGGKSSIPAKISQSEVKSVSKSPPSITAVENSITGPGHSVRSLRQLSASSMCR